MESKIKISPALGKRLLYFMLLMRQLENRLERLYRQGKISGSVYIGRGQEAISVGSAILTEPEDVVCPSHRDLGAFLIRGLEPRSVVANYLGKGDGPTRGRDGNTHLGSLRHNIVSYISSMAAIVPVAGGVAFAFHYRKQKNVVLCYFGDGATSRGEWHEALNFAAVYRLPVIYICNNNGYAYSTPVSRQMPIEDISERGSAYNIPGVSIDGNDVLAVYAATREAIKRARAGHGPTLIECKTFRMGGHGAHDTADYVPKKLREKWERRDPIQRFQSYLQNRALCSKDEMACLDRRVTEEVDRAVLLAEQSPEPDPAELLHGVYADEATVLRATGGPTKRRTL